jgi:hypothetical protein
MAPRDPALYYYPGSGWQKMLFDVGYEFETPIPLITPEGVKPFPPTGYRTLDARTDFFYGVTGITPAMAMRLPGIGSTYLWTMVDAKEGALRRRQDLQGDTAEGHPTGKLLVVHALRQHVALNARHTTALPARGQPKLSITRRGSERGMVRRRSTSVRRSRRTSNGATGFRPCPVKALSRACGSTVRLSRSFAKTWRPSEVFTQPGSRTDLRPNGPRCFDWCRLFQPPSQLNGLLLIYLKGSSWLTPTVRA